MFTKRVFELQARVLGRHVLPMCLSYDWNKGGARVWDLNRLVEYQRIGNLVIDAFLENPNFDISRFNDKVWWWFEQLVNETEEYLLLDKPGMYLTGSKGSRLDWTFVGYPV